MKKVALLLSIAFSLSSTLIHAETTGPAKLSPLLEEALAGPMRGIDEIVFCTRLPYGDPHWYANIGYYCDEETSKARAGNGAPDVGALRALNVRTGDVRTVFDAQGGSIRDPQVHYDAKRILFSYRPVGTDYYHLYEINTDGSSLRQITSGDFDDYEATYLPDGDIAFVSTRCNRWVNCWVTQVGIIYRCSPDGSNIRQISANTEHDNTPWMLPDGRILYMRWEYVDRSQVEFHHLWAMNPDGTQQVIYYGNMHPGIVMIDAKPIPGTNKVLANFSPGHGVSDHAGIATIVSPDFGPDERSAARPLHKGHVVDPYPLSEQFFIAARGKQLLLMNADGRFEALYKYEGDGGIHEPRPIMTRERESVIPPKVDWKQTAGRLVLSDVYKGRNMAGIKRGDIKKLLVLETLPKQVNFSGGQDLLTWAGTFSLERVLGTVPVEEDGSAYFEAPANRQIFFVALGDNDLSIKRMQSFTSVAPGETAGCVGCHEERKIAPENRGMRTIRALQREPSKIEPFTGLPDVLDFNRDIQPILDRHCVQCHNYEKREGNIALTNDLGPNWSHAYFNLLAHRQVADGRNGLGNETPRALGSSASALLRKAEGGHHDVKVSEAEWRTLWLWIESGAVYAGTYAGLRNQDAQEIAINSARYVFVSQHELLNRRCNQCHTIGKDDVETSRPLPSIQDWQRKRQGLGRPAGVYERIIFDNDPIARYSSNILLNLTRPECSPLVLGPLAKEAGGFGSCGEVFKDRNDPDYKSLLEAVQKAKAALEFEPRFATPGFKPNRQYIREMKKYGILPQEFDAAKDPIDWFEADQKYWQSLWHQGS